MQNFFGVALTIMILAGCSTVNHVYDHEGKAALAIECGASTSFSICHDRARQECPRGYKTLSEKPGFNRKEIWVRCNE